MTIGGWIFMLTSVSCVTALVIWCFYRILTRPEGTEHIHAPLEINTHDREV